MEVEMNDEGYYLSWGAPEKDYIALQFCFVNGTDGKNTGKHERYLGVQGTWKKFSIGKPEHNIQLPIDFSEIPVPVRKKVLEKAMPLVYPAALAGRPCAPILERVLRSIDLRTGQDKPARTLDFLGAVLD